MNISKSERQLSIKSFFTSSNKIEFVDDNKMIIEDKEKSCDNDGDIDNEEIDAFINKDGKIYNKFIY